MWIPRLGAVSVILLAFEMFVLMAIAGVVLYYCIRWTHGVRRKVRPMGSTARGYVLQVEAKTRQVARGIVGPLVEAEAALGAVAAVFRGRTNGARPEKEARDEA